MKVNKISFLRYFTNKYLITLVIFTIWMIFFDNSSLLEHIRMNREFNDLIDAKAYYSKSLQEITQELSHLKNDSKAVERIAREKFFLKRKNEDIFIVVSDSVQKN